MTKTEFKNLLTFAEWSQWCGVAYSSGGTVMVMQDNWNDVEGIDNAGFAALMDIMESQGVIDPTRKAVLMASQPSIGATQIVPIAGTV